MIERQWLASCDPEAMLKWLIGFASARKLQLFACACARRYWDEFDHPRSKRAIEVADGLTGVYELHLANNAATAVSRTIRRRNVQKWEERGR